jgi:hypothetical protein
MGQYAMDTSLGANINWNLSASRIEQDLPPQFNFFNITSNPGADVNFRKNYAYLLYPTRLFLKPISLTKNSDNWELTTSTVVIPSTAFYFSSNIPEAQAEQKHFEYLFNTTPVFENLPNNSNLTISHNLSATRYYVDKPVFYFSDNFNPVYHSSLLETDLINPELPVIGEIRKDSALLTYDVVYYKSDARPTEEQLVDDFVTRLSQHLYDIDEVFTSNFTSSYITNYDNIEKDELIFQMIQNKPEGGTLELSDSTYCVLSSNLDFKNLDFQYFCKYEYGFNFSLINALSGVNGSYIGLSYILDSEKFTHSSETWQSSFIDFKINNIPVQLNQRVNCSALQDNTAKWKTKYPPHYYGYKASVYSPSKQSPLETNSLNFYLKSKIIYTTTNSCVLSSYISTEHNLLKYDLETNTIDEYIKYEIVNNPLMFIYDTVQAYYGPNFTEKYDILNETWVPVKSGTSIFIDYPDAPFGQYNFSIRATLCSKAGLFPACSATHVEFATELPQYIEGTPLYFKTFKNVPNDLELSVAHLSAWPNYPAKDLRNSYITWSYEPTAVPVILEALDVSGKFLKYTEPNIPLLFSDTTSRVRFTNFGFQPLTVTLSSQKYSDTVSISSTASNDPYIENQFAIGFSAPFDNEMVTRKACLTAALPFAGQTYTIPLSTSVSWMWKYNFDFNPDSQPIKAYVGPERTPYTFGDEGLIQDLSALYLEIIPVESDTVPPLNSVKVFMVTRNRSPFVSGQYEFFVDDFPSRHLLNTDMTIYYINSAGQPFEDLESSKILNTRLDNFVITRPNDGTNMFSICANEMFGDIWESTTFVWNISDNYYGQQHLIYTDYADVRDNPLLLEIESQVTETIITLSALSAWPAFWRDLNILRNVDFPIIPVHSIYTTITINTPSPGDFYKPLEIISYPQFTWNNSQKVTILSEQNYTLAASTTAYKNEKSGTVGFFLSANKNIFNEYDYYISSNTAFLSTLSSQHGFIRIPYSDEFSSVSGLQITLTAFGVDYPSNYPIHYVKPESRSLNSPLCTYYFPITSQTISRTEPGILEFKKNPLVVDYDTTANFNFTIPVTNISLNNTRQLTIIQNLETLPLNSPVRAQLSTGTITYAISSEFWSKTTNIPTQNGTFKAFNLNLGDPYEVGYLSNSKINTLLFKPLYTEFKLLIPSETFSNYSSAEYSGERNLWNEIPTKQFLPYTDWKTINAYSTGIPMRAFVSDFITITGKEIQVEYLPVNETASSTILFYKTYFGEDNEYVISDKTSPAKFSFSKSGTFYISYEVQFTDGTFSFYTYPTPIKVKSAWESYNQEAIRTLSELTLQLPYTLEQIEIQPNEWGEVDIFNTAVTRLYENLEYLIGNIQTINTDFPTLIYGWLGCANQHLAEGIRWYSKNFDRDLNLHLDATKAINSSGSSYFSNISAIASTEKYLYVLQDSNKFADLKIRVFDLETGYKSKEVNFFNQKDLQEEFVLPIKMVVNSDSHLYVLDKARCKVVRLGLDFKEKVFNIDASVGSFGSKEESNKFNIPSDITITEESLYVLDYGNNCIKEFNLDLNWLHTYYIEDFDKDPPIAIAAQYSGIVYAITTSYKVYVLEQHTLEPLSIFSLDLIYSEFDILNKNTSPRIVNFTFDEVGEFIYIAVSYLDGSNEIFKYSAVGVFVGSHTLYKTSDFILSDFIKSNDRYLLAASDRAIIKMQDVVDIFKIGEGLPYKMWSLDQILLSRNNFASDLFYNKALNRLCQNVKMFRDNLNGKFVKVTEQTPSGVITYFTITPTAIEELPIFDFDLENNSNFVGVDELHIPQVLNREFKKIYDALISLKLFLDIGELDVPVLKVESVGSSTQCEENFCWSWKATSGYNLKFPAVRICNVNPITYLELRDDFPISYAPTNTWEQATSDCCSKPEHLK